MRRNVSKRSRLAVYAVAPIVPPPLVTNLTVQVTPHSLADHQADPRLVLQTPGSPRDARELVSVTELGLHVGVVNPRVDRTQLLDGPAFAGAIRQLRQAGYDHIVVDAPPVLGSADVCLMAEAADAVLLAVRVRRTTARDVRRAIDRLGAAKVAGTVVVEPCPT